MSKYKKYGKWFAMASAAIGVVLLVLLSVLGAPLWLALILAVIGAVPGAIALGVFGIYAWLDVEPESELSKRHKRERAEGKFAGRVDQSFPTKYH